MKRFVLLFALFAGIGFALVLAPPLVPFFEYLTKCTAAMSADVIRISGGHIQVKDYTLTSPTNGFSIVVVYGCNGINVIILLWAAQLAWPAGGWRNKLKAMALGALIIQAANTLRIISLFYLGQWNQAWFEAMHLYVWEILIMVLGLAVFAAGIRRIPATAVADGAR